MSDTQKPVEETPAAAPATETPATETPAAEAPKDTPAENTEAAPAESSEAPAEQPKEEATEEAKKEVTPATDGVLGYKAPGLVKGLRFAKRYFYFSEEAVESKQLAAFLQNEKPAVAHPIAAWASQTGKGLLFFAKRAEDKATPAGIFNLADVTDVSKEGSNELVFKVHGHKHTFQASNAEERDSWVAAIEAKSAEAKAEKDTITASEGYKAELEKLGKPAEGETKEEGATEEGKANTKSRSQSRKRASIFGTVLGKKPAGEEKEIPEESKPAEGTEAPAAEGAAAETPAEAPAAEASEDKKEEKKAEAAADKKAKRASLFGNFFQKVSSPTQEKAEKDAAQETTPVSSTAPQLENPVEESKPAEETPAAPAEGEAAKDAAETPAPEPTPKDKRRTSFFGNLGIKKDGAEGEGKPKKLGGLFRKPSKAVKGGEKEKEAAPAETIPEGDKPEPISKDAPAEDKPAEEGKAEEKEADVAAESVNVASNSTPVQAAA